MRRLLAITILAAGAVMVTIPATAGATQTCTVTNVGVNNFASTPNPGYSAVNEGPSDATCSGVNWYEESEIMSQRSDGSFVSEHCGANGSICFRLRPASSWAAGTKEWCTPGAHNSPPTNDYGSPCAFDSVDQDPCVTPMILTVSVFNAATRLPMAVGDSTWICKVGTGPLP